MGYKKDTVRSEGIFIFPYKGKKSHLADGVEWEERSVRDGIAFGTYKVRGKEGKKAFCPGCEKRRCF